MTNDNIQRMLEINSRIEKGGTTQINSAHRVSNQKDLDKLVESYDTLVYGPSTEPVLKQGEQKEYKAEEEMKHLKEIKEQGGRGSVNLEGRKIPKGIVESILDNPLDMLPIDPRMDALEQKLKDNMSGIKAAANIFERVEKKEQEARTKINENIILPHNNSANIDYETLKEIIETCIDNKISELKMALNESVSHHQTYVPSMKYMNFKDKWLFVDNDDNVFECVMKYRGKRKKKVEKTLVI